jgi:predicted DNA-binding protein YlxM (UPF0122 family)
MATVAIKILKDQKKRDGTYNVKIRITHNRQVCYISTHYYVSDDQLSKGFALKDSSIHKQLHDTLRKYRVAIGRLGNLLEIYSAIEIKDHLIDADKDVDFIKFSNQYIDDLLNVGRKRSAGALKTVVYSLIDYFKSDTLNEKPFLFCVNVTARDPMLM